MGGTYPRPSQIDGKVGSFVITTFLEVKDVKAVCCEHLYVWHAA